MRKVQRKEKAGENTVARQVMLILSAKKKIEYSKHTSDSNICFNEIIILFKIWMGQKREERLARCIMAVKYFSKVESYLSALNL